MIRTARAGRGAAVLTGVLCLACSTASARKVGDYFAEDQNLPTGVSGSWVTATAKSLPYAYYPSVSKLDVAIQLADDLINKARGGNGHALTPRKVHVLVRNTRNGRRVASGVVPLNEEGYGRSLLNVPDFPDGEYSVEYAIGEHKVVSPKRFKRIHFPFEKTDYGEEHKVYPPFTPVKVRGRSVAVIGREYSLNPFCLFKSVRSLGRELLAAPVTLVGRTVDDRDIVWSRGRISGTAVHEDEAVFNGAVSSPQIRVESQAVIGEDGCAAVKLRFTPGGDKTPIESLRLVVPLKDKEMPLFHYIADNAMRLNYAGKTPRGGKIRWYREKWDGFEPYRWKVETPGSDDGVLITSADPAQYNNEKVADHRPFIPYIWLGAEERGLAVFMEGEEGFITDEDYPGKKVRKESPFYDVSLNRVVRRGSTLAIEVDIFRGPCTLKAPREITLGFMASPGKPMEKEFRTRAFASGAGVVVCWGGWLCASKYPANHDWSIVDKIQEIRARGGRRESWIGYLPEEEEWFRRKGEEIAKLWPGRKVYGKSDWLKTVMLFANGAKAPWPDRRKRSGTYFEEHAHDVRTPEWEVFQDEWASVEFNRFQKRPANWGVFSPSYQDFALYMANEWLKRGVSLYFDNTKPKRCYNVRFGPAYYTEDGKLQYGISMLAQRRYYRRIYKLLKQWNERGVPYQVDFTVHMTNTATLPLNTWATATLDFEQRAHTAGPGVPAEPGVPDTKGRGYQLPWPPDYLRAVTFGRQCGAIPLALDLVSGHSHHVTGKVPPKVLLRNWTMARLHDIRAQMLWPKNAHLARTAEAAIKEFGYGTDRVVEHNYWHEKPFIRVSDKRIKWMALVKTDTQVRDFGLLLLQSYSRTDAIRARVTFPRAGSLVDVFSGQTIPVRAGVAVVEMPANFSSRLFTVAKRRTSHRSAR